MHSISRRTFMQSAGAVAALAAGAGKLMARPLGVPIGVQLYCVRDLLPKDFDGTLAKVRGAGYTDVEAAGYYDRNPCLVLEHKLL